MMKFKSIGIECNNLVIRREDIKQFGIEIINDSNVHRIHDNCFRDNLEIKGELVIPNHITKLGMFSFSNCTNLTKLVVPSTIKEIPYCCFEHCSQLVNVELPDDIQLERNCFWQCSSISKDIKEKKSTQNDYQNKPKNSCCIC